MLKNVNLTLINHFNQHLVQVPTVENLHLTDEMEIHQELKKSINDLTKYKEISANSSAGTVQRTRAFQELRSSTGTH